LRRPERRSADALEGRLQRLHGERKRVDHRRDHEPCERERQGGVRQRGPEAADPAGGTQQDQEIKAEHRRRQHERERDDRFDYDAHSASGEREPPGERGREQQQYDDGDGSELQAEPNRSELEFRHLPPSVTRASHVATR
jgi:hypothetical protein